MSDYNKINKQDLDNFITGHYGEDQFGPDEEEQEFTECVLCSCLIGDEVGFGDNYGEGPICENCIRHIGEQPEQ